MPIYSPEMLRWGKIYRRKKHPQPSAPNFLYKEALSEPYNSAKFPEKPSGARAFRPDGVKNVPTRIVSNPSRDGVQVRQTYKMIQFTKNAVLSMVFVYNEIKRGFSVD